MESWRFDRRAPEVALDLHRQSVSQEYRRKVADVGGCPWTAVAAAFTQAREERRLCRQRLASSREEALRRGVRLRQRIPAEDVDVDTAEDGRTITETMLRQRLIMCFGRLSGPDLEAVIQAKIEDPLSFFFGYPGVQAVNRVWPWYLASLTFERADWAPGGAAELDEEMLPARVPLDLVDLQVLVQGFKTDVLVVRVMQKPWQLTCPEVPERERLSCTVCYHEGLWAPVLGRLPPDEDLMAEKLVKLCNLPIGDFEFLNGRPAHLTSYDDDLQAYEAQVVDFCGCPMTIFVCHEQIRGVAFNGREEEPPPPPKRPPQPPRAQPKKNVAQGGKVTPYWVKFLPGHEGNEENDEDQEEPLPEDFDDDYHGPHPFPPGRAPPFNGVPVGSLEWQILHELVRSKLRLRCQAVRQETLGGGATSASRALRKSALGRKSPLPTLLRPGCRYATVHEVRAWQRWHREWEEELARRWAWWQSKRQRQQQQQQQQQSQRQPLQGRPRRAQSQAKQHGRSQSRPVWKPRQPPTSRGPQQQPAIDAHSERREDAAAAQADPRASTVVVEVVELQAAQRAAVAAASASAPAQEAPDRSGATEETDTSARRHTARAAAHTAEEGSKATGEDAKAVDTTRKQLAQSAKGSCGSTAARAPSQGGPRIRRLQEPKRQALRDVFRHLGSEANAGRPVLVRAAQAQRVPDSTFLTLADGEEVILERAEWYRRQFEGTRTQEDGLKKSGMLYVDTISVYEVTHAFSPEAFGLGPEYLPLSVGDSLVVLARLDGEWRGWARGRLVGDREGEGLFKLQYTTPRVLVLSELGDLHKEERAAARATNGCPHAKAQRQAVTAWRRAPSERRQAAASAGLPPLRGRWKLPHGRERARPK